MSSDILNLIQELQAEMIQSSSQYERDNELWWNTLTAKEREDAFYAVVKRIHKAELTDRRTYRGALYDVFGFDSAMHSQAIDCGYFNLHNTLFDGLEYEKMCGVNRFEVIDDKGRTYVKYLKDDESIKYSLQDDNRTLKVFIDTE